MEKKILVSGKELEEMRTCPECGARGLIDITNYTGGIIFGYVFDCGCGCRWECKTKANIDIEKQLCVIEQEQRWFTRLFNR